MKKRAGNDPEGTHISEIINKSINNFGKWFGLAAVPVGETHRADRMDGVILPFQLVAGNNDFGSWVQLIGSDDTPINPAMTKASSNRFMVTSTNSTNAYILQFVSGESADIAAKLAAEQYTETPYKAATNSNDSGITDLMTRIGDAGTKVWARCACVGGNTTTLDLYFGLIEFVN